MEQVSEKNDFFYKDWKKINRQKCEIYTRICWYLRPKTMANIWKRQEFIDRNLFDAEKYMKLIWDNNNFRNKYSVAIVKNKSIWDTKSIDF